MKLQRLNTESTNLANHKFNKNKIGVGNSVIVNIGYSYSAVVEGLKLDEKNKKVYAYLKNFKGKFPSRVDVSDCIKIGKSI